jgi:hypothetical protein
LLQQRAVAGRDGAAGAALVENEAAVLSEV